MASPAKELLKKVSSVSAAAAALLSASSAGGLPNADAETNQKTQDALDALKRRINPGVDQVRFQMGGQVDPETQEILLAGHRSHSSHSSHSSGSYIGGSRSSSGGSSGYGGSSYTPYAVPYTAPASTPIATPRDSPIPTPRPAPLVYISFKNGTRLSGTPIQKGAWGLQLRLKDNSRIQIARSKLRPEDVSALDLPTPMSTEADVPAMVYLCLNDGQTCVGRVSAADGERVTVIADNGASRVLGRAQMDPDTFLAAHGLVPDPLTLAATAPSPAATPLGSPGGGLSSPAANDRQVLIKLKNGNKLLVTLLSKSANEIAVRTRDGHDYRIDASRLSAETLAVLQLPAPNPSPTSTSTGKHK